MHLWSLAIATLIAGYAVERVDIYKQHIAIAIDKLNNLSRLTTGRVRQRHKTVKTTHSVIYMDNIISNSERIKLGSGHLLVALNLSIDFISAIAVENLMLCIERQSGIIIHKTLVQQQSHHLRCYIVAVYAMKNILQTLHLRQIIGEDIALQPFASTTGHIIGKHLEVLAKTTLWLSMEDDRSGTRSLGEVIFKHQQRRACHICNKGTAGAHLLDCALWLFALLKHLNPYIIDPSKDIVGIIKPIVCPLADK